MVTNSAVNIESTIPIASVAAKPLTVPEPLQNRTAAAIRVVTFPSMIAESALAKPALIAFLTDVPRPISSLIRVKMITFASTAIPIDRMIPATPGSVRVTSNATNRIRIRPTYRHRARDAARPGRRYTAIINTMTMANPIRPAFKLVEIASWPSFAPTTLERSSSSSRDREPIRIVDARLFASS